MTDERPESLAAQAASWVPPWERPQRPPDPAYAAARRAEAEAESAADDLEQAAEDEVAVVDAPHVAADEHEDERAPAELEATDEQPVGDLVPTDEQAAVAPEAMSEQAGAERSAVEFEATGEQAAAEEETQHVPAESEAGVEREAAEAGAEQAVGEFGGGRTATGDEAELSVPDAFADGAWQAAEPAAMVDAPVPVEGTAPDEVGEARAEAMDAVSGAQEAGQVEPVPEEAASGIPAQGRRGGRGGGAVGGASTRTEEEVELKPLDEGELRAALEAILLVVDEPVAEMQLAQIVEQPTERVAAMLEDISARYTAAGHGFDLRRAAGGWRLYTRPEYAEYVERFVLDGQSVRLTQAALETLAVVAYKQPVTRSRISAIRGVNCDGVMRTLVTRGLIEECGVEGETGAFLYRTTALFLEKLGLNSVDQLPPLAPFLPDDVEEVLDASG